MSTEGHRQRPVPQATPDTARFWEGCAEGVLLVQRCDACGHNRLPPAPICPRCWSRESTWTATSGRARLRSSVVFHQLYHPAFADAIPYTIGLVELDEGPSLYATLVVEPGISPPEGARLALALELIDGGVRLPAFRPVPED